MEKTIDNQASLQVTEIATVDLFTSSEVVTEIETSVLPQARILALHKEEGSSLGDGSGVLRYLYVDFCSEI